MMQERVDQGAIGRTRRGMHHKPGRLVQNDKLCILPHHVQGNILRLSGQWAGWFDGNLIGFPFADPRLDVAHSQAVTAYRAFGDQPRQARTRQCSSLWHIARQRLIKAVSRVWPDCYLKDALIHV
jgi:hypothetical protein